METTFTRRNSHGANLKRWREWRGIKQEVLADKIGVSQATLSGYEKKDELEPEVLEKITKALDIPIEAITELNEGALINTMPAERLCAPKRLLRLPFSTIRNRLSSPTTITVTCLRSRQ